MRRCLGLLFAAFTFVVASTSPSDAQNTNWTAVRDVANSGTVGVMGGGVTGTSATLVWDMTNAMDDGYDLRVIPFMGKGSIQTIEDILVLRGVDIGIVQSDVLDFYKERVDPDIKRRIAYIAKFYDEEIHLIVRDDITSLEDLAGKRVNLGPLQSGNFMTSSILFDRLGIDVVASSHSHSEALEMMRQNQLDAIVRVAGKPTSFVTDIAVADGFKLLPVPAELIGAPYVGSFLSSDDYPQLVPPGQQVPTIAVPAVMAAYNWPLGHERRVKVEKFARAFYEKLPSLQAGNSFHPKWREIDANDEVSGWTRFALPSGES